MYGMLSMKVLWLPSDLADLPDFPDVQEEQTDEFDDLRLLLLSSAEPPMSRDFPAHSV